MAIIQAELLCCFFCGVHRHHLKSSIHAYRHKVKADSLCPQSEHCIILTVPTLAGGTLVTFDFDIIRSQYIDYLFCLLARHEPFTQRLEELRQAYSALIRYHSWAEINVLKSVEAPKSGMKQDSAQAKQYYESLSVLVKEYGLNPDWAIERINYGIVYPNALVIGAVDSIEIEPRQYTITWDTRSFPTKKRIEEDILKQLEAQWCDYEQTMIKAGFIRTRKRGAFEGHMRWVFKRICLKQSWSQIAAQEHADMDRIRKSVVPIINLLGLEQPKLKGGRPRK